MFSDQDLAQGTPATHLPSGNDAELEELAARYFVDELGLDPRDVPEAARNLLGAFEVLLRISERLKKRDVC